MLVGEQRPSRYLLFCAIIPLFLIATIQNARKTTSKTYSYIFKYFKTKTYPSIQNVCMQL